MKKMIFNRTGVARVVVTTVLALFAILPAPAADDDSDDIIEFLGDRYVIHVDKMHPDSEMTLLDVLHTCPEFLSENGKTIDLNYSLCVDDIDLIMDAESFLANVKACEIDYIEISSNSSVAKPVDGTRGVIDVYYREDMKTDGKVALAGSTYGNGMLYTDVTNRSEKLAVQAYALAHTSYGKAYPTDANRMTDRSLAENVHVRLDWKISDSDRLLIKAYQTFNNNKLKLFYDDAREEYPFYNRYVGLLFSYTRTFQNESFFVVEMGSDYTSSTDDAIKTGDSYPYGNIEFNTPLFTPDLWLMVGSEVDYENLWYKGLKREQYMLTDFYAQLDYKHGPWVLTLGDRYRMMNFWNRQYDSEDFSLWKHHRNNHSYLASVGYKAGRHFVQGLFARRCYIPVISDFLVDETAPTTSLKYDADSYGTNLAHQAVLRYSYQQRHFFFHSSVESNWYSNLPGPNQFQIGFRNSVYWKKGPCELTLGANYYHHHVNYDADTPSENHNYVTLKAAPVLLLPEGFRLSSTLLYVSRRSMFDLHPHLFATVKVNKQWGKKCNIFAEYHDLAGYATGNSLQLSYLDQNRALSLGVTFYPFR
jgi:hypothetical protein